MVRALRDAVITEQNVVMHFYCAPQTQNSALFPVIDGIQRAAQFERDDTAPTKIAKLKTLLTAADDSDAVAYVADLLSLPMDNQNQPPPSSPERQKERLLDILVYQIASIVSRQASLIFIEDAQWIDATSLFLFRQFIRKIESLPVLILLTARPEFEPPWLNDSASTILTIGRLDNSNSRQVVQGVARDATLSSHLMAQILEKSDGVPLFLEEITKAVLEFSTRDSQELPVTAALTPLKVPSTLQNSLMSRLDRLGDVKEVAQIGATIGRRFSFELLATVSGTAHPDLRAALRRLVDADLVNCRGSGTKMICAFRHALVRDAAYSSLLRGKKRALHHKVAEVLERTPQREEEPELLAYHFTEAHLPARAIPYWEKAGHRAASRAAHVEASNHFVAGLGLLAQIPKEDDRLPLELALRTQLALSLSASRGYAAPEVLAAYDRARELCQMLGNKADLFAVLRGLCTYYFVRDELAIAMDLAKQCTRLGEETHKLEYLIEGYTALGYVLGFMGELSEGVGFLRKAIDIYEAHNGQLLEYPTPQNPYVLCLSLLPILEWARGNFKCALSYRNQAFKAAQQLDRPFDLAVAHDFIAMFENIRGEYSAAATHAEAAVQISREHGFGIWHLSGVMHLAIANGFIGKATDAIESLTEGLNQWRSAGAELNRPFFLFGLAEVAAANGFVEEALIAAEQGIQHARNHQENLCIALLYRRRGLLLKLRGASEAVSAEVALKIALDDAPAGGALQGMN